MKRSLRTYARRLFTTLSVLSLLLCVGTVVLWVRGRVVVDRLRYTTSTHHLLINFFPGHVDFVRYRFEDPAVLESYRADPRYETISTQLVNPVTSDRFFGLSYSRSVSDWELGGRASKGIVWWLTLPHWSLALLFAVLPTYSTIAYLRHRKQRLPGHCRTCGYDLRATPDRCPECGIEPQIYTDAHR